THHRLRYLSLALTHHRIRLGTALPPHLRQRHHHRPQQRRHHLHSPLTPPLSRRLLHPPTHVRPLHPVPLRHPLPTPPSLPQPPRLLPQPRLRPRRHHQRHRTLALRLRTLFLTPLLQDHVRVGSAQPERRHSRTPRAPVLPLRPGPYLVHHLHSQPLPLHQRV